MKFKTDEEALSWLKSQPYWGYTLSADEAEVWAGEYDSAVDETLIGACEMLADAMKPKKKVSHTELMEWADENDVVIYPFNGVWYVATLHHDGTIDRVQSEDGCIWSSTPWKALIAARKVLGR